MKYQYITDKDSGNYTPAAQTPYYYGMPRVIDGFTYHWWGNPADQPTFDGIVSWLCRPNGNTSAHYVVEAGRVACIVSPLDTAWHSGSARGNATTIGIECNPRCSDEDYETIGAFSAQLIDAFGDKLKYKHSDWQATQCPGNYDINRIDNDSYMWLSGADWGTVTKTGLPTTPPTVPVPVPPVVSPEWVRNMVDIEDVKLCVMPAGGARRVNLTTLMETGDVIPKGTWIDIAKETTVGGRVFLISNYSAAGNMAIGIPAEAMGVPEAPSTNEKPEWMKNLEDITDQDFWTRSETPVLNLEDGSTVDTLPINTKVRVTHSTVIAGNKLMVLDGKKAIEVLYLSDKMITDPSSDLEARVGALESLVERIREFLSSIFSKFNK